MIFETINQCNTREKTSLNSQSLYLMHQIDAIIEIPSELNILKETCLSNDVKSG